MIELQPIHRNQKETLRNLFELYTYDFSEYMDVEVDDHGRYATSFIDRYFQDPSFYPFLVLVDGRTAGFAIVKEGQAQTYSIHQFFIMKKFRRSGTGSLVATKLFDRFPGHWSVAQIENNLPAQLFWRKIIGAYTKGDYTERYRQDHIWRGPIQEFTNLPSAASTRP